MAQSFDLVIVGAGAVGLSLALSLARATSYRILLIDIRNLSKPHPFERSMALSFSSQKFYSQLDMWKALESHATPIEKVHVSMQHYYGTTRISKDQLHAPALGYVLSLSHLESSLLTALRAYEYVTIWDETSLESFTQTDALTLVLNQRGDSIEVATSFLVGTDGVSSQVAKCAGIEYTKTDYGHSAVICHVNLNRSHENVAFERFTQEGALAFLPFGEKRATFVWTMPHDAAKDRMALSESDYLQEALNQFGFRLGRFTSATARVTFPLIQSVAKTQWQANIALLGNSAHTLHPIAAQGLNLSLRDILGLTEVLAKAQVLTQEALVSAESEFLKIRMPDQARVMQMTDKIARYVSSPRFPGWLKASMMVGLDTCPPLKQRFSKLTMGLL